MKSLQIIPFLLFLLPLYTLGQSQNLINKSDTILYLPYQEGKATFSYKGKMGVIDSTGKVIVPATFSRLNRLFDSDIGFSYRFYYDGNKQGILDEDFNIVIPVGDYDDIEILIGGFFRVKKNRKYSYVDIYGKCFGKWFDDAKEFRLGLAPVKTDGKWGFINSKCDFVIQNIYSEANGFLRDDLAAVKLNGKWGFVDQTGKVVIPFEYDKTTFFINNNCSVRKNGLWGYIDKDNTLFIPYQFDEAEPFFCELALVKRDGMYGYINKSNDIKIPFQYRKAYSFYEHDRLASVKFNGKWTHITKEGKIEKTYWDK
jgi:hypothetical protein